LRIFLLAAALLALSLALAESQVNTGPTLACTDKERKMGGQDLYYFEALSQIKPPEWKDSLISITVGAEVKLILWTDGTQFRLLTDTPKTPRKIHDFFLDLDRSCRLPSTPDEAVKLVDIQWESTDLTSAQFGTLHRDFTTALGQYAGEMQNRYNPLMRSQLIPTYLDAVRYTIVYDNHYQHDEVQAWDVPEDGKTDPMVNWVHELHRLGEAAFHRPFPY
jgi:hypothetical protein